MALHLHNTVLEPPLVSVFVFPAVKAAPIPPLDFAVDVVVVDVTVEVDDSVDFTVGVKDCWGGVDLTDEPPLPPKTVSTVCCLNVEAFLLDFSINFSNGSFKS